MQGRSGSTAFAINQIADATVSTQSNSHHLRSQPASSPRPSAVFSVEIADSGDTKPNRVNPSCRILIVDDDAGFRDAVSLFLQLDGAEVSTAEDGQVGVELALKEMNVGMTFDVVLMEVDLPVLNGQQAARRLRSAGYVGQIIALSCNLNQGMEQEYLDAGCDAFIVKLDASVELPPHIRRCIAGNISDEQ